MKRFLLAAAAALVLGACASAGTDGPGLQGQAVLKDKAGRQVGLGTFTEDSDGLRIEVTGVGLAPGPKGIHIHAVGKCEPPDFVSAGAHFNPAGKKHGRLSLECVPFSRSPRQDVRVAEWPMPICCRSAKRGDREKPWWQTADPY
jgi:Cu/Zn superoxide dismutase